MNINSSADIDTIDDFYKLLHYCSVVEDCVVMVRFAVNEPFIKFQISCIRKNKKNIMFTFETQSGMPNPNSIMVVDQHNYTKLLSLTNEIKTSVALRKSMAMMLYKALSHGIQFHDTYHYDRDIARVFERRHYSSWKYKSVNDRKLMLYKSMVSLMKVNYNEFFKNGVSSWSDEYYYNNIKPFVNVANSTVKNDHVVFYLPDRVITIDAYHYNVRNSNKCRAYPTTVDDFGIGHTNYNILDFNNYFGRHTEYVGMQRCYNDSINTNGVKSDNLIYIRNEFTGSKHQEVVDRLTKNSVIKGIYKNHVITELDELYDEMMMLE